MKNKTKPSSDAMLTKAKLQGLPKKLLLGLCITMPLMAYGLPNDSRVPGGVAVIPLPPNQTEQEWQFNDQSVLTVRQDNKPIAVVGIPLSTKPGMHSLCVKGQKTCLSFKVFDKAFPEQRIKLKTNKHVNLSKEDLERHAREKSLSKKAFVQRSTLPPSLILEWPAEGPISSEFGLKRFYNDQPRNPHTGLDIAAPRGAPVTAPAPGKVVLVGDFFFNGKVVYVNHGDSLVSMFCHLDKISVKQGDQLQTGDPVGAVGSTGRATGPHLHWTLSLRNVRIDPTDWLRDTQPPAPDAAQR